MFAQSVVWPFDARLVFAVAHNSEKTPRLCENQPPLDELFLGYSRLASRMQWHTYAVQNSLRVVKMARKSTTTNLSLRKVKTANLSTTKNHRFEPFSQRIARLKIDPIRRSRDQQPSENESSHSTSYFRNALDEWVDRNLSEDFTELTKQVVPLCDSLPQLLYHEQKIMDLLLEYIKNGKTVSLEPLLDLVSHFAHDLGLRFEKYFERTVSIVSELAAKHQDVEVIEWAFNCLAWLFKYLSKLLVPDLRPVYNLMAHLLGKERQKPYIARFAAEVMSFLIRKAGSYANKDKRPLEVIVGHILYDLVSVTGKGDVQLYEQGLIVLFSESIKGSQDGLHSGGPAIFAELLSRTRDLSKKDGTDAAPTVRVVEGVLLSLLHHTADSQSFKPILEIILVSENVPVEECPGLLLQARLLLTVAGVRNDSKSSDWSALLDHIVSLLSSMCSNSCPSEATILLLEAFAVAHQKAPLNFAITHVKFLEVLASESRWRPYFLGFCAFYGDLGKGRFKDMLLPHFTRFLLAQWSEHKAQLCIAIPRFATAGFLGKTRVMLPTSWQMDIVNDISGLCESPSTAESIYYCNGLLELLGATQIEYKTESAILSVLETALENTLRRAGLSQPSTLDVFTVGKVFETLMAKGGWKKVELWPLLCASSSSFKPFHIFLQAMLSFIRSAEPSVNLNNSNVETLVQALSVCLASPSHQMRLTALQILEELESRNGGNGSEILRLAISVASTTPSVETIRTISMHLRNLAKAYAQLDSDSWLFQTIPYFFFGLLHVRLAPVWDSVYEVLKEICCRKECEEVICNNVFKWIEEDYVLSQTDEATDSPHSYSHFEKPIHGSPDLDTLQKRGKEAFNFLAYPQEQLKVAFDHTHAPTPFTTSFNRTQALRVLQAIPQVAEKKSRMLVPVLLQWALDADISDDTSPITGNQRTRTETMSNNRWSRKDQKAMLAIFSQFSNPKVLYKSSEVYSALYSLLSHGDVEIQKSALRAIFTWKNAVINRYEEQLLKFLDEAKFKEQLSVFLDIDSGDDSLQEEHRANILPLVFRLIYGRIITRGRGDQQSNRRAVFILLSRFNEREVRQFLSIILGRLDQVVLVEDGAFQVQRLNLDILDQRRQLGLINMLYDLLDTWKATGAPFAAQLVEPVMYCLVRAANENENSNNEPDATENNKASLARSIRQISLRCVVLLFDIIPNFNWTPYLPTLFKELVSPRLNNLAKENAQAVSGLLRLFSVWSRHVETVVFLSSFDDQLLPSLAECISNSMTKDIVRRFVVNDICGNLVVFAEDMGKGSFAWALVAKHAAILLQHLGTALKADPSKELLEDGVRIAVSLADIVSPTSTDVISTLQYLLLQPSKKVSPPAKTDILRIIHKATPSANLTSELFDNLYDSICLSFAYFYDRESRVLLCDILQELARKQHVLKSVANICSDLNSFASNRVDEPDYERRAAAFNLVNEQMYGRLDAQQWKPLLQNMLFYVRDVEELAIRASAGQALRRFVDVAAQSYSNGQKPPRATVEDEMVVDNPGGEDEFMKMLDKVVLMSIEKGIREQPELVRAEYLSIVAHAVNRLPSWPVLSGMASLTGPDDESSFFNNILHIQQHRRVRALKRLVEEVKQGRVANNNLAHFVIPLVERFVFDAESRGDGVGEVTGEAMRTIGILLQGLNWNQFNSVVRRYVGDIKRRPEAQETVLKLVDGATIALSRCAKQKYREVRDVEVGERDENMKRRDGDYNDEKIPQLQQTLPNQEKLSAHLLENFLPALETFLREKNDSVVSRRSMVAVIAARIMSLLPKSEFQIRLPAVLLDTCNILRSKDPVSRDTARKSLGIMCQIIGPSSISFILKALRSVLQRGFHLHVLSFTVHSILVTTGPELKTGDLDYCVSDMVTVVMDDVFGNAGQEKEELEFLKDKASKKEVKQKKSFDTMQLLASVTSLPYLIELIRPIELLLLENLTQKMLRDVDELLRRIELGLMQNSAVKDRDILIFCHELITDANKISQGAGATMHPDGQKGTSKYLIRKVHTMAHQRLTPQARVSKVIRFGLELVRGVFRTHKNLASPANIAGFLPIIGDAVIDDQEDLKLAAFRLFTQIIKVPLPRIEHDAPVYVAEAVKIVEGSEGLEREELPAAALKLVAAVLREKTSVKVKDRVVGLLVKQLRPDLQVKNQQGSAFTLLRAIIARKVNVPEIYELIDGDDGVAAISVRDHDRTTRDLARGVWFQFLLDYPQGKGRFKKQLSFLAANLQYEHAEGRQSVMETLHLLLTKIGNDLVEEVIAFTDWSLVAVMVNDEDESCREMASSLVKTIIGRANEKWIADYLAKLRWMLEQENKFVLRRTALQCWSLYLEVKSEEANDVEFIRQTLEQTIDPGNDDDNEKDQWELVFYALHTLWVLCEHRSEVAFSSKSAPIWNGVHQRMKYPHSWVKHESAKLIGLYLKHFAQKGFATLPLVGPHGLTLDKIQLCSLASSNLRLLRVGMSKQFAGQVADNLTLLGACFAASELRWCQHEVATNQLDDSTSDDESGHEDEESNYHTHLTDSALEYLFRALSGILRREPKRTRDDGEMLRRTESLIPRRTALNILAKLIDVLSPESFSSILHNVLLPLIHLTDSAASVPFSSDSTFSAAHQELVSSATELMDLLQKKLGTTDYVKVLQRVKKDVQARREERRRKRKIEAVAMPERAEKLKKKKRASEKLKRKEKGIIAKGRRRGW